MKMLRGDISQQAGDDQDEALGVLGPAPLCLLCHSPSSIPWPWAWWQKLVILAAPPRNPRLGLVCVNRGKGKDQVRAWLGSSPAATAQDQGMLGAPRGHGPSLTLLAWRVEEGLEVTSPELPGWAGGTSLAIPRAC